MIEILYEDNHVICINKPDGWKSQDDGKGGKDVLTEVKNHIKVSQNKPGNVYLGLVHRLDRNTSGVMILAKTSKAASRLSDGIRRHKMNKEYLCICAGLPGDKGRWNDSLIKDVKTNLVSIAKEGEGKDASLEFQLVKYVQKSDHSLVRIKLITGRSHQIRVQFSHRGFPLLGDVKYGGEKAVKAFQLALFAESLTFEHPTTKEFMTISAKPKPIGFWREFVDDEVRD